ncbi:MAG: hypothetical protein R3B49_10540 [Phycisphaerales bacterium]
MSLLRHALFGGALFAAGVAHAGGRVITFGSHASYFTVDGDLRAAQSANGPVGVGQIAYGVGDFLGFARLDNDEILIRHNRDSTATFAYTGVYMLAFVHALETTRLTVSWDHAAWGIARSVVFDEDTHTYLAEITTEPPGQLSVTLEEGHTYLLLHASAGAEGGGHLLVRFAPASACVADINGDGILNLDDIDAFATGFIAGCS